MVKVLAVNDETTVCECCGKSNLKRVVTLELENGSIVRYGRDCAARKLGKKITVNIDSMIQVTEYIAKWSEKYPAEIVNRGINQKIGYYSKLIDGYYHVQGVGIIPVIK